MIDLNKIEITEMHDEIAVRNQIKKFNKRRSLVQSTEDSAKLESEIEQFAKSVETIGRMAIASKPEPTDKKVAEKKVTNKKKDTKK